jgi:hypothetical protein
MSDISKNRDNATVRDNPTGHLTAFQTFVSLNPAEGPPIQHLPPNHLHYQGGKPSALDFVIRDGKSPSKRHSQIESRLDLLDSRIHMLDEASAKRKQQEADQRDDIRSRLDQAR